MKTNTQTLKLTAAILSGSLLAGCGGIDGLSTGDNENDDGENESWESQLQTSFDSLTDRITGKTKGTEINARFVDGPVSNLQFESNTYSGVTGSNGEFKCASGEEVEFSIGALSFGTSICQTVVTPQTLAAELVPVTTADTSTNASGTQTSSGTITVMEAQPITMDDDRVLNRVRLLMTLDTDPAVEGIQLPTENEQDTKVTTKSLNFASATFVDDVNPILTALSVNGSLVEKTAAYSHFVSSVATLPTTYDQSTGSFKEYVAPVSSSNGDDDYNEGDDHEGDDRD